MADKANPLVDEINKILTNTLDYREVLMKLSDTISHEATSEKLREFAEIKQDESQNLIKIINDLGGQVETNERMTDQESIYWIPRKRPETNDMEAILNQLIDAEKNIKEDYNTLLSQDEIEKVDIKNLKKHKKEAEANLNYFQVALRSLQQKK